MSDYISVNEAYLRRLFSGYGRSGSQLCTRRGYEGWSRSGYTMYRYFVRHHFVDGRLDLGDLDRHFQQVEQGSAQSVKTRFQFWHNLLRTIPESDRVGIYWGKYKDWEGAWALTESQWSASKTIASNHYDSGELTAKEQRVFLSWDTIQCSVASYLSQHANITSITAKDDSTTLCIRRACLLCLLYTTTSIPDRVRLMGPRRLKDIMELRTQRVDVSNWLDLPRKVAVIEDYKTAATSGVYELPLSDASVDLIQLIISSSAYQQGADDNHFVFGDRTQGLLTTTFNQVCGRALGVRILRKSFVEWASANKHLHTWGQISAVAHTMGNTATTLRRFYCIINDGAIHDAEESVEEDVSDTTSESVSQTTGARRQYTSLSPLDDGYKTLQELASVFKKQRNKPWKSIFASTQLSQHNGKSIAENLKAVGGDLPHNARVRMVNNTIKRMPEWSTEAEVAAYKAKCSEKATEYHRKRLAKLDDDNNQTFDRN